MNDHAGGESTCGWEMGNNEFSWSGLMCKFARCSMLSKILGLANFKVVSNEVSKFGFNSYKFRLEFSENKDWILNASTTIDSGNLTS